MPPWWPANSVSHVLSTSKPRRTGSRREPWSRLTAAQGRSACLIRSLVTTRRIHDCNADARHRLDGHRSGDWRHAGWLRQRQEHSRILDVVIEFIPDVERIPERDSVAGPNGLQLMVDPAERHRS